jgi:hypothetical protein
MTPTSLFEVLFGVPTGEPRPRRDEDARVEHVAHGVREFVPAAA